MPACSSLSFLEPSDAWFGLTPGFGLDAGLGEKLGLRDDFVLQVIQATGNYGEIYARNLGPDSQVPIPRGLNRLGRDGGVMVAPPFQ